MGTPERRLFRSALRRCSGALLAAVLAAAPVATTGAAAQGSGGQHMLWTVSRGGDTLGYLVGSVHLMKKGAYPLPDAYAEAFRSSDVIAFETHLDSAQARSQQLIQRLGVFSGDGTLRGALPDSTWSALRARADSLGLNLAGMRKFEPWVVALVVPVVQMQQAGYSGRYGVDRHFLDRAKKAGKEIVTFESPAEQLRFFDELPPERQVAFLQYSLRQSGRVVDLAGELVKAWSRGDVARVDAIMQGEMKENFPGLYRSLIVERNRSWMERITELLRGDRRPMIVVGVGHMTGEHGLVSMLREEGFTVTQQ